MNTLQRLQNWYLAQCNGDWEHAFGVKIDTLDNPGWLVTIDLRGTSLENATYIDVSDGVAVECDRDSGEWLDCKVADNTFKAAGGPHKLEEMLTIFLDWADGRASKP